MLQYSAMSVKVIRSLCTACRTPGFRRLAQAGTNTVVSSGDGMANSGNHNYANQNAAASTGNNNIASQNAAANTGNNKYAIQNAAANTGNNDYASQNVSANSGNNNFVGAAQQAVNNPNNAQHANLAAKQVTSCFAITTHPMCACDMS